MSSPNPFDEHQAAWDEYRASPWGRLRYELVARTLSQFFAGKKLRILDVGGGDGGDALPLFLAGHEVTVLDSSREMLVRAAEAGVSAREGSLDDEDLETGFDAVLCHFVLQYRSDLSGGVRRLGRLLRPGGTLSLILPTAPGQVLSAAVRRGPREAHALLGATSVRAVAFDQEVQRFTIDEISTALRSAGFEEPRIFGIRMINDLITDDERKKEPDFYKGCWISSGRSAVWSRSAGSAWQRTSLPVLTRLPDQTRVHGPICRPEGAATPHPIVTAAGGRTGVVIVVWGTAASSAASNRSDS